ncbi:DUF3515 family protein [Plantactinospora sp. GCM10030261]|uniref:DUF3515 family protein n=1 Tax=Plantactinospora sp. GCM10030261 TaxID=3273420 RepID=UPI0036062A75
MERTTSSRPAVPDQPPARDPAARQAARWATAVALPVALLVGLFAFFQLRPEPPAPSATAPGPQSTAPVTVAAPALPDRAQVVCRALIATLPGSVRDLRQRPVTAGPEQNAAYGDPALLVRCGVPPVTASGTDDLWNINGVCWLPEQTPEAVVLTTVDREVPIAVTVPRAYPEALQWTAPLAEATLASVRSIADPPRRCRG